MDWFAACKSQGLTINALLVLQVQLHALLVLGQVPQALPHGF
jgi:hypothetical protein